MMGFNHEPQIGTKNQGNSLERESLLIFDGKNEVKNGEYENIAVGRLCRDV
jgi:hypothetical protein